MVVEHCSGAAYGVGECQNCPYAVFGGWLKRSIDAGCTIKITIRGASFGNCFLERWIDGG